MISVWFPVYFCQLQNPSNQKYYKNLLLKFLSKKYETNYANIFWEQGMMERDK